MYDPKVSPLRLCDICSAAVTPSKDTQAGTLFDWATNSDPEVAQIIGAVYAKHGLKTATQEGIEANRAALQEQEAEIDKKIARHREKKSRGRSCENCGLPEWAVEEDGFSFRLESAKEKFKTRAGHRTVWCCSGSCVAQPLARNKYGESSHKWPVTLAEFRQLEGQAFLERLECYETTPQSADSTDPKISQNEKLTLPYAGGFRNASGRPRTHSSNAARQRAYRAKKAQEQEQVA